MGHNELLVHVVHPKQDAGTGPDAELDGASAAATPATRRGLSTLDQKWCRRPRPLGHVIESTVQQGRRHRAELWSLTASGGEGRHVRSDHPGWAVVDHKGLRILRWP
jgi:hypothetical protein